MKIDVPAWYPYKTTSIKIDVGLEYISPGMIVQVGDGLYQVLEVHDSTLNLRRLGWLRSWWHRAWHRMCVLVRLR